MKTQTLLKKFSLWFVAIAALAAISSPANAASTQGIDIRVSINAIRALTVSPTYYDYGALNVNTSSVSASSLLVTNTSGSVGETYTIAGANASSLGGGTSWTLAATTSTIDTYVLAAMFGTGMPANDDNTWATSVSSVTTGVCSAAQFGNGNAAQSGAAVSPVGGSNQRNLWFRIITPSVVSDATQRQAVVTLAVQ